AISVCGIFVVVHHERYFMTAAHAHENLILQIHGAVGWLDLFEPQLATAVVAVGRRRRFDEGAHAVSFRPRCSERGNGTLKRVPVETDGLKVRTLCAGVSANYQAAPLPGKSRGKLQSASSARAISTSADQRHFWGARWPKCRVCHRRRLRRST